MKYTRITDIVHPLFGQAWELYRKSFPAEERRQLRTQKKIMHRQPYHFELVTDEGMLVGIILWWGFDDVRYIEHLATLPRLRGKGYGKRILERFVAESDIPVLLEVEHPTNEIARRRIGFYQRAGFVLNAHEYWHPPYKKGGGNVSLMLMTCPEAIDRDAVRRFCEKYHPVIHEFVLHVI